MFGIAKYCLNRKREINLIRPENHSAESDVEKFKMYIVNRIQILLSDRFKLWDIRAFTELRDLVVSRLTLFNARRG